MWTAVQAIHILLILAANGGWWTPMSSFRGEDTARQLAGELRMSAPAIAASGLDGQDAATLWAKLADLQPLSSSLEGARSAAVQAADDLRALELRRRLHPSDSSVAAAVRLARAGLTATRAELAFAREDAVEELLSEYGAEAVAAMTAASAAPGDSEFTPLSVVKRSSVEARSVRLATIAERRALRQQRTVDQRVQAILGPARADYRVSAAQSRLQVNGAAVAAAWGGVGIR